MVCVLGVLRENKTTPSDCSVTSHLRCQVFKWKTSSPQGHKSCALSCTFHYDHSLRRFMEIWKITRKREVMYLVPIKRWTQRRRSAYNWLECVYTCFPPVPPQLQFNMGFWNVDSKLADSPESLKTLRTCFGLCGGGSQIWVREDEAPCPIVCSW